MFSKSKFFLILFSLLILCPFYTLGEESSNTENFESSQGGDRNDFEEHIEGILSSVVRFLESFNALGEQSASEEHQGRSEENQNWISCINTTYSFFDFDKSEPILNCYEINMRNASAIEYFEDGTIMFFLNKVDKEFKSCHISNLRVGKICVEELLNSQTNQ